MDPVTTFDIRTWQATGCNVSRPFAANRSDLRQKSHHTLLSLSTKECDQLPSDGADLGGSSDDHPPQQYPAVEEECSIDPGLLNNDFEQALRDALGTDHMDV